MKVFLSLLGIMYFLLGDVVGAGQFPDVKIRKINDRVYALLGDIDVPNKANGGYVSNVLVVVGDNGVILVDTGSHRSVSQHIARAMANITMKPVTHIFITHHHFDHHLGASAFPDANLIASEYCVRQIEERGTGLVRSAERMIGMKLSDEVVAVPRTKIPPHTRREMTLEGIRLEAITLDTAHTEGDLIVWLPDDKILASGDILVHGVNPNFAYGNVKSWIGVVAKIRKLPFDVVMPGHGDLMKPADVAEFASLISGFYKIVLDL